LLLGGRHVHSPRDPLREAERLAEFLAGQGGGVQSGGRRPGGAPIVVLGFGLGYGAEAAAKAAPGRPLIIAESRRDVLRKALEERDLSRFLSENTLAFVVGGNGESAIQAALGLFPAPVPPAIIRNRALMAADEAWYAGVEQGIRSYTGRGQVNSATLRRFGRRWVRNLAANLAAIRDLPGIARLAGVLAGQGIPVFLAAAGPSLDQAAPLLGELQKRCVIVAVDTSLRFLLRRGLAPDFVVSVDPQYWNFRHLDRCAAAQTWLIAEPAVYPPALRHGLPGPFRGCFLCRSMFPLGRFIEDRVDPKGALGAGGSVATTAWDFARVLGAPSIWIAGLDLSFPDLKTHFKGALFETRSHAESNRRVPAETWSLRALRDGQPFFAPAVGGGTVLTDQRLSLYASWFAARFREFPAVRSYRLSSSGIVIPGLEQAEPGAVLDLPERRGEIDGLLEGTYAKIEGEFNAGREDRERRYRAARAQLLAGLRDLADQAAAAASLARSSLANAPQTGTPQAGTPVCGEGTVEERRIVEKLDAALQSINNSEVKEAAFFLVPPEGGAPQGAVSQGKAARKAADGAEWAFARYLERSARTFQDLSESAEYQINVLNFVYGGIGYGLE
jgi:hypothetical protein